MSDYAKDVLVETEELEGLLSDSSIRIVEVDEDTSLYEKGHIPGAVNWDWAKDLHHPVNRDFIDEEALAKLLARSAIGADEKVIIYSGNNNWFASYAYWLLKYRGFEGVKLLNGGRKKWELESRELNSEVPNYPAPGSPAKITGTQPELRAIRDDVLAAVVSGDVEFIDVRSPEEYRGELLAPPHLPQEQSQVPGHIPGAHNIPWSKAAQEDGTFRPADELRRLYQEEENIEPGKEVVAYCRIGERSSHTWFVLQELLGYENVKNYDGSWTEYGSLVSAPVEL